MKISRAWLQKYFNAPLPEAQALTDALTFHAFEIESVEKLGEDDILDVKVTPNRGHDCLSHRSIAKELAAILDLPITGDPFRSPASLEPHTEAISVTLRESALSPRYIACLMTGVAVGPSPEWLRKALEAMGQRSINNVVDATNYVMFDLGQPLHAFDAGKLAAPEGTYSILVRPARAGEAFLALDGREYSLTSADLVVADGNGGGEDGVPVGIAGVKGGMASGVDEATAAILIEAANFDGVSVRRTAASLKLRTDASARFEQGISPEIPAYGMRAVADLIATIAGGTIAGFADAYPHAPEPRRVSVSLSQINGVLGTSVPAADVAAVFHRLDLPHAQSGEDFSVSVPFERLDIGIPEDLVEEAGRIIGYDKVPLAELPPVSRPPAVDARWNAAERMREALLERGYSEVYTSSFAESGERVVANKIDGVRPCLRASLLPGLAEALARNARAKDFLGVSEVKIFEIGVVWRGGEEMLVAGTAGEKEEAKEEPIVPVAAERYGSLPVSQAERYRPFSRYPFIVRDIALWTPDGTNPSDVLALIRAEAGSLLVRSEKFDEYRNEKTGKISYAFRLVFQSFEKTLTDPEANAQMEKVTTAVKSRGWEVR